MNYEISINGVRLETDNMTKSLKHYEWAKERLRVKLIHFERNKKLLQSVLHERILDLAVVPYVLFNDKEKEFVTVNVPYPLLSYWSISDDTLLEQAKRNTFLLESVIISKMSDFIKKILFKEVDDLLGDIPNSEKEKAIKLVLEGDVCSDHAYILTNEKKINGAFLAFQSNVLSQLAEKLDIDELYILPSSIHECATR